MTGCKEIQRVEASGGGKKKLSTEQKGGLG